MTTTGMKCKQCSEELIFITLDDHVMIRPMRFSKCKYYRSRAQGGSGFGNSCREVGNSWEEAVAAFGTERITNQEKPR